MESVYGEEEDYYAKCGELYLTIKGNIAFHCTLCENRYKDFQDYNEHIQETHYGIDIKEQATTDPDEEDNFDAFEEEVFTIDADELMLSEDNAETYEIVERLNEISNEESEEELVEELVEQPSPIPTVLDSSPKKEVIRTKLKCINIKPTITNRKYKCPHCGYAGADKSNVQNHIKRHSMHKPHKCPECTKTFHTRTEMKTHLRSHTGERPFLCTLCGRAFITASQLTTHQRTHSGIRDKECPICKKKFYDQKRLRGHMVRHSDKRDHKCDQCDASFKERMGLRNHIKLHENKREYECKLCDARFNQNAGLYSHMKNCHTVVFNSSKVSSKSEPEN